MVDPDAIKYAEKCLKEGFKLSGARIAKDCQFISKTENKHCNATTQATCRKCRFFEPTLEAKKKFLEWAGLKISENRE